LVNIKLLYQDARCNDKDLKKGKKQFSLNLKQNYYAYGRKYK